MGRLIPRWRKMTWVFWVVNAFFLWWVIAAANATSSQDTKCNTDQYASACHAGTAIGAGIGFAAIILLWFIAFVVFSLLWFMTRPSKRLCPVCGESVKKGRTVCKSCGHDFAAAVAVQPATTGHAGGGE